MDTGDILYSNVCARPLCLMVRRGDGQFWDFAAGAFAAAPTPLDPKRFALQLTADAVLPTLQLGTVPAKAAEDPAAVLVEAEVGAAGSMPKPTQSYWLGGGAGVPLAQARGCTVTFTP